MHCVVIGLCPLDLKAGKFYRPDVKKKLFVVMETSTLSFEMCQGESRKQLEMFTHDRCCFLRRHA